MFFIRLITLEINGEDYCIVGYINQYSFVFKYSLGILYFMHTEHFHNVLSVYYCIRTVEIIKLVR